MGINKYRNCLNDLIYWEWRTLKKLRKERRKNILLRGLFASFSFISILFCIFSPSFILANLLYSLGVPFSVIDVTKLISLFIWLWFISPMDKLSKKEREEKNKRKIEVIKALENAFEFYEKNKKRRQKNK